MSLRDELPSPSRPGPRCTIRLWIANRDPDDPEDNPTKWNELLDDPTVQGVQILAVLRMHGFPYGYGPVIRHRRRFCNCA